MAVLVTGGAGFIGSHTAVEIINSGKDIVVVDNLCNSNIRSVETIKKITNLEFFPFFEYDCCCKKKLREVFEKNDIESVIHFAGLKAVIDKYIYICYNFYAYFVQKGWRAYMAVLVTGGAGFIGSHTAVEIINSGKDIVVVDNLCNSNIRSVENIKKITNLEFFPFFEYDCCCKKKLREVFEKNDIESVIHFAGLKAVGESVLSPLKYYSNNLKSTLTLCEVMNEYGCNKLVFSSSATVYGAPKEVPIKENFPTSTTNPYGYTKLIIENILRDICFANSKFSVACLRYFNPIGAHRSGLIGEVPNGIPNNLMPYITQVAAGKLEILSVFGNNYPTCDGTGVRDYIHVVDLAKGHLDALNYIENHCGFETFNLGTGVGYSVLEIIKTFEEVNGVKIPYKIVGRRPGDIAICYADPSKSKEILGFKAKFSLEDMCRDSWRFAKRVFK